MEESKTSNNVVVHNHYSLFGEGGWLIGFGVFIICVGLAMALAQYVDHTWPDPPETTTRSAGCGG